MALEGEFRNAAEDMCRGRADAVPAAGTDDTAHKPSSKHVYQSKTRNCGLLAPQNGPGHFHTVPPLVVWEGSSSSSQHCTQTMVQTP